ncbi:MAG: T9SS type A sorting domain-containing protein [Saprospiraceae bacterium]|nr:T9SS type A sorting domain-containing protein [Saprospiraceae bacterium]
MKLLLVLILNISLANIIWAQKTYCKLFDLDPIALYNVPNDMKVKGNNLVIGSTTLCKSNNDYRDCTNLSIFSLEGLQLQSSITDSFSIYLKNECITFLDSNLIVSGNIYTESNASTLITYDKNLNLVKKINLFSPLEMNYINYGILIKDDLIYINGILLPRKGSNLLPEARLVKMKYNTKEIIWEKSFKLGNYNLESNDLQFTPDGHLAFILYFIPPPGIGPDPIIKIIKINTYGEVLDSFQFNDIKGHGNRLLVTKDNNYYFSSVDHPINGWDWKSTGRINKLNSSMDMLDWNLILPNNPLPDGRSYIIEDYIEVKNGDILAVGSVRENSDSKIPGGDLSSTYNGFIVRVNSTGNIVWLRIFRMPQELLDITLYGQFRESSLNKIVELESGEFIACGDVYYNGLQASVIDRTKIETDHLWLIRVNPSGCLDGYPCDTIFRIRPSVEAKTPNYNIGTQWTFETDYYIGGGHSEIKHTTIKITDTVNTNGKKVYYLSNRDSIYFENGKMFFWDEKLKSYEMYYDFNSTSEYEIKYYISKNNVQIAKVKVDSVYNTIINLDTIPTQLLRISNNGSFSDDIVIPVYKNIGASYYEIKLYLGKGFFDPSTLITKLRCFKSDTIEYNFQNYPCDSIWFTTNTTNLDDNELIIVPNPTSDYIQVLGIESDLPYELYNIHGQKKSSGVSINGKIIIPDSGVFILKIKLAGGYSIHRILKL